MKKTENKQKITKHRIKRYVEKIVVDTIERNAQQMMKNEIKIYLNRLNDEVKKAIFGEGKAKLEFKYCEIAFEEYMNSGSSYRVKKYLDKLEEIKAALSRF